MRPRAGLSSASSWGRPPAARVFSILSTIFGANIWTYRRREYAFGRVWSPFQQCSARSP